MSYTHITPEERYVIAHLRVHKLSIREIGRRLNRSPSTISRELRRNGPPYGGVYWYDAAQKRCTARKNKARHRRRQSQSRLYAVVVNGLRQGLSPELIAGRLEREYPRSSRLRISHEGIYQWVYQDAREGGDLYRCLIRCHKRRRRQRRRLGRKSRFEGSRRIEQRPDIVDARKRYGDWESDTLEGGKGKGGLATHVERKSRYLRAGKLPDKRSDTFTQMTNRLFASIPRKLRKTMTVDNGSEFAGFREIEALTGMSVYFADPYCAWQRGTNENTNGLLRRYFPKGFDFRKITSKDIEKVVKKLNNRPRKCLNYRTPHEVLFKTPTVALLT